MESEIAIYNMRDLTFSHPCAALFKMGEVISERAK